MIVAKIRIKNIIECTAYTRTIETDDVIELNEIISLYNDDYDTVANLIEYHVK